jgi:hypothetical protein
VRAEEIFAYVKARFVDSLDACHSGHRYALARANSVIADSAAANRQLQIDSMEIGHHAPPFLVIGRTDAIPPQRARADAERGASVRISAPHGAFAEWSSRLL